MSEVDRYREAATCGEASNSDRELAIFKALEKLCWPSA
jgi:hypothetical protein